MLFLKLKRMLAMVNSKKYVSYLRELGAVVGENTDFLSPIHSNVDFGRAKYITIGKNCILCAGISIIAHDYSWKVLEDVYGEILPSGGMPISIGNNVFIGANTTILGGTTIGDNVIVAAGSVVCGDLPSNTVCAGTPAKVIKPLEAYYQKRKAQCIQNAKQNARYLWERLGQKPTIEDMRNFLVLFMPRTEENLQKYVFSRNRIGGTAEQYAALLKTSEQRYENYEAFLDDALRTENVAENDCIVDKLVVGE